MCCSPILTDGELLKPQNISNIIVQNSYILILAIGMILIIIAGHIDLSVGSVVALTGAIAAVLMVNMHVAWPLAIIITLVSGALIGAWQGYWVAYFGIPAFIVTLAGLLIFRALTLTVLGNQGIGPFPDEVRTLANGFTSSYLGNIGLGPLGGADLLTLLVGAGRGRLRSSVRSGAPARGASATGSRSTRCRLFIAQDRRRCRGRDGVIVQLARFKNLPWVLVLLAVLVLAYTLLTNRAVFGRHIYAIGGNLHAASLSGIKVKSVTFWIFVNMGVLAALAGVIFAGRLNQAGPTGGHQLRAGRHRRRVHRRRGRSGRCRQGGRRHHRRSDHGCDQQRHVPHRRRPASGCMLIKGLVLLAAVAFDVWTKRRAGAST